jgi:hypothetical protein
MEYKRYKPKYERPFGMGVFFDYGAAVTKQLAARPLQMTPWRKKTLAAQQRAEEVWDAEGGNSQTRIAPRPGRDER